MDLGIAGRRAIICASSRGAEADGAEALAAEGVDVFVTGETRSGWARRQTSSGSDSTLPWKPSSAMSRRKRGEPHCRAPSASQTYLSPTTPVRPGIVPVSEPGGLAQSTRRQSRRRAADDPLGSQRHARTKVRPDHQHHLSDGRNPTTPHDALKCSPSRPHRRRQGAIAGGGLRQRNDQQPPTRTLRHRPSAIHGQAAMNAEECPTRTRAADKNNQSRQSASEGPRSSARHAHSYVAETRATSRATTFISTAAAPPPCSDFTDKPRVSASIRRSTPRPARGRVRQSTDWRCRIRRPPCSPASLT